MAEAKYEWSLSSAPVFCHVVHKDEFAVKLLDLQNNKHKQQRKDL
jgi:hypothetical protein